MAVPAPRVVAEDQSPFHEGEQAVQARLGVRDRVEKMGKRMVRSFMPEEHRAFFEALPFLIVGSVGADGSPWASLLVGEPGFAQAPTPRNLVVRATPWPGDPLASNVRPGAPLGLLGIELVTRRRNRLNGLLSRVSADSFEIEVDQSFGNCKQYIQGREGRFTSGSRLASPSPEGALLSPEALAILASTDTAFIATSSLDARRGGAEGLDVSHRGGRPGFIRGEPVDGATVLTLPDFYGNFMFNSFGNLEVNPRAGLLALDFDGGAVLSLTGTGRVIWDGPSVAAFAGAERLLEFRVGSGWLWRDVLEGWSPADFSPQLDDTGVWAAGG